MADVDVSAFDARLKGECGQALVATVTALREAAEQAGPVVWRAHSTPGGGWGLIGRRNGTVFLRLDPKPRKDHVQALILNASVNELSQLGTVADRPDQRWVAIGRLADGNLRLVQDLLLKAYAAAAGAAERGTPSALQALPSSSPSVASSATLEVDPTPMSQQVTALKHWYDESVKPFLAEHMPDRIGDLDKSLERIEAHDRRVREDLAICFLGDSGIGKSTLINALVAGKELLLPTGGIGPLTALAMEVRHGEEPSFEAEYHPASRLWQGVVFGLERGYEAQLKSISGRAADPALSLDATVEDEDEEEIDPAEAIDPPGGDEQGGPMTTRLEALRKQANLLVKGNQDADADLPYLLDCLRQAAGRKVNWGTTVQPEDRERVARLASALTMGKEKRAHRCERVANPIAFHRDLADHASGFLAPLIRTLHVTWPSAMLQHGIVLVDLPGVGIAGDVYRDVTRTWINERAKAVVLVVGRSGVTEAAADLLRTSGFLTRLLFSSDERAHDPVILTIAMSHIDDVAQEAWANERALGTEKPRTKAAHLVEQFDRARAQVRSNLRHELERVWASGDADVRSGQQGVIDRLVEESLVFPVSAPQYRRVLAQEEDDRPFITTTEESGVPAMEAGLVETVRQRREDAWRARDEAIKAFADQVAAWVELVREQWTGGGHTEHELEQLKADLNKFIAPLRKEFLVRQGQFREFLKSTMPAHIRALVGKAKESARSEISQYLRGLGDAHWATLRAAVRREGTFYGARRINLPDDFAQKFVEPVAEVWGKSIIQEIRKRTREFAADCERMVVSTADWCRSQGARVPPKLLDAQVESLRADIKQIDIAGRDIINGLRDEVKDRLTKVIHKPIQTRCRKFVSDRRDTGPGVKFRMLTEVFSTLAEDTTDVAADAAEILLLECFKRVSEELRQVLKDLDDPLESASENILQSHRGRLEKSDAKNRDRVLSAAGAVVSSRPQGVKAAEAR